jgi:hypothetical protein
MDVYVTNQNQSDTVQGTTTAAYVEAVTITNCAGATLTIANISSSATMYYKITGYKSRSALSLATIILAETNLAASASIELPSDTVAIKLNYPYARIVVSVMQHSGAGAYQIDYNAY